MAKSLKYYTKSNYDVRQWLDANGQFFTKHPHVLRQMIEDPEVLQSFNDHISHRRMRYLRKLNRIQSRQARAKSSASTPLLRKSVVPGKTQKPSLIGRLKASVPSIPVMTEKISQVSQMLEAFNSVKSMMK